MKKSDLARMNAITQMMKGEFKVKKKRVSPMKGKTLNNPEAQFRKILIKYLRKKGCKVRRVEPATRGKFDLGDLYVTYRPTKWAGWIEVKSLVGRLSEGQKNFKEDCLWCGVRYIEARKLEDVENIFHVKLC